MCVSFFGVVEPSQQNTFCVRLGGGVLNGQYQRQLLSRSEMKRIRVRCSD